jgi:hypothetical protein
MSKSAWKTTSVQDCGCQNQQKHAFSFGEPMKPGEDKIRIKPCVEHTPAPVYDPNADASCTYEEFWGLW